MKRTFFLCLLGMLLLMGCQKDNIVTIDATVISESGNDITNTTFTQTVYVTFSGNDDALVTGTNEDFNVTVDGNHVTVVYPGDENVMYTLTGTGNNTSDKSAKAIKFDGNLVFSGGKVVANSTAHEGIEAKGAITVTGGEIYSYSQSDDAINSGGNFTISGGYVYSHSAGNDGLDANGDCYIKGGVVYAIGKSSPEVAIDANTEGTKLKSYTKETGIQVWLGAGYEFAF